MNWPRPWAGVRVMVWPKKPGRPPKEDCNGSQLHPGEEISRKLVVTCGDGAEVLERIEEAPRPDCVHNRVRSRTPAWCFGWPWRNDRRRPALGLMSTTLLPVSGSAVS